MRKSKEQPIKQQVSELVLAILEGRNTKERVIEQYVSLEKSIESLDPRDALQIMKGMGLWTLFRSLAPFESFPTKKVRFKVFPQSEEKLAYVKRYKEAGTQTMKDAIDTVLELLLHQLPDNYRDHKADVVTLLTPHLPPPGGERPVSLSMNSLGYALLQDLAELLGQSQGAVLEAAAAMWLIHHNDLVAKRKKALEILNEFSSEAYDVEDRLKEMFDDSEEPVCNGFGRVMIEFENLRSALEDYVIKETPSWREHYIEGHYE